MAKIGRNDPCPCKSGEKYKKCHGSVEHLDRIARVMESVPHVLAQADAAKVQRERQQGFGAPIISAELNGTRMVAVRNRLFQSRNWNTFHDFLIEYIKATMSPDWWKGEVTKPLEQRHPITHWYQKVYEHSRKFITEPGKVSSGPLTGAYAAFLQLAYDLYALDHNVELQEKLLGRLKNLDNFEGARYEVSVAGMLIRAGFLLEFENEDDRSSTHCEFTATYKKTGKKFSVEAKRRGAEIRPRLIRLLQGALRKKANYQRIVFIDINMPDDARDESLPAFMASARDRLRMYERTDPASKLLPSAYILVTNSPFQHHLDQDAPRSIVLTTSFHIPELSEGWKFDTLRQAITVRDAHVEMLDLIQSMQDHSEIPATFDGEIPEFAFGENKHRLIVGERYELPNNDGGLIVGTLSSAEVIEQEKTAMCVMTLEEGSVALCKMPLSDLEMAAWRRHPDTFFGVVGQRNTRVNNALEMYDFLFRTYQKTSKDKLIEFMAPVMDKAMLVDLDQPTLASMYCERMAISAMANVSQRESTVSNRDDVVL
ncbi:YecA family protein [Collimonas fungivorans]|uniref:SEC-C motif-containing protein n=1 Tax=Collimonas fungivorans (strain Ter331) TaxID=1005048 RepID=G0AIB8_COLFT|nr:SEC-C metal-binding domain-containing protein [Collimonas fungivorans]AEK60701.1 hypothetical protein CFU_0868 [Collimonas fungivorans Ter331]